MKRAIAAITAAAIVGFPSQICPIYGAQPARQEAIDFYSISEEKIRSTLEEKVGETISKFQEITGRYAIWIEAPEIILSQSEYRRRFPGAPGVANLSSFGGICNPEENVIGIFYRQLNNRNDLPYVLTHELAHLYVREMYFSLQADEFVQAIRDIRTRSDEGRRIEKFLDEGAARYLEYKVVSGQNISVPENFEEVLREFFKSRSWKRSLGGRLPDAKFYDMAEAYVVFLAEKYGAGNAFDIIFLEPIATTEDLIRVMRGEKVTDE